MNESIPIFAIAVNVLLIALTGIPPNVSSTVLTVTVASAVPPSKFEIVIESAAVYPLPVVAIVQLVITLSTTVISNVNPVPVPPVDALPLKVPLVGVPDAEGVPIVMTQPVLSPVIPESVTTIGAEALKDCTALGSISCLNKVAPTLVGSDVFLNVLATTIDVPIGAAGYGVTYGGLTVNYVL